jgi:hypothetical protein
MNQSNNLTVEINTPNTSFMLTSSDGNQVCLYLTIPLPDVAQRLSETGIFFENPDGLETGNNTSCWRLVENGIDLYFGTGEQQPCPQRL